LKESSKKTYKSEKSKKITKNGTKTNKFKYLKVSKKIRRNLLSKSENFNETEKNEEKPLEKMTEPKLKHRNETEYSLKKKKESRNQLKKLEKIEMKQGINENKAEKMKSIHITHPEQTENYLRIIQQHIGIIPAMPPQPYNRAMHPQPYNGAMPPQPNGAMLAQPYMGIPPQPYYGNGNGIRFIKIED